MKEYIVDDLVRYILGEYLGSGSFREVYRHNHWGGRVLKVEHKKHSNCFENVLEYETWSLVLGTRWEKWFAPCESISPSGHILTQVYCHPMEDSDIPKMIPSFFCDVKSFNWGRYKGRIVCYDYGHSRFIKNGLKSAKLVNRIRAKSSQVT